MSDSEAYRGKIVRRMKICWSTRMENPGPIDPSLLVSQPTHRSHFLWTGQLESDTLLNTRHHPSIVMRWPVDDRVLRYVREAGLYGIHRVGQIPLDRGMITALVERWRPETHTFHLSVGEATITLRDVAILTDLPVSGRAVTGPSPSHTRERIHRMFGVLPPDEAMMGSSVKATWLHNTFAHLPGPDAEDAALERYARIYCWVLISGYLFVDKSGNDMQGILLELLDQDWDDIASYSWASAALAFLYRHLCRAASIKRGKPASDIAGPLVILQLWIWEHITFCTPAISTRRRRGEDGQPILLHVEPQDPAEDEPYGSRWLVPRLTHLNTSRGVHVFRDLLDRMTSVQMIWDPYPAYRGDEDEWRVRTPMIFFDVVEYHYPERVMRQYGLRQTRPGPPEDHNQLHEVDRRGKATVNWAAYHRGYIEGWDGREDYVVHGDEIGEPMDFYDDYLIWYRGITRRFISRGYIPDRPLPLNYMPSSVPLHVLTQQMLSIRDYMHSQRHVCHEQSNEVVRRCDSVMVGLGYEHMLQPLPQNDAPCSSTQANAQGTSNDHQSPYTLSVRPTAPGMSQGECSYVSPVHPTNVRLYQESDSEGTPLVYPSLDTIYEGDTPTADS